MHEAATACSLCRHCWCPADKCQANSPSVHTKAPNSQNTTPAGHLLASKHTLRYQCLTTTASPTSNKSRNSETVQLPQSTPTARRTHASHSTQPSIASPLSCSPPPKASRNPHTHTLDGPTHWREGVAVSPDELQPTPQPVEVSGLQLAQTNCNCQGIQHAKQHATQRATPPLTRGSQWVAVRPDKLQRLERATRGGATVGLVVLLVAAHGRQEAGGLVGVAGDQLGGAGAVTDLEDAAFVGDEAQVLDAAGGCVGRGW